MENMKHLWGNTYIVWTQAGFNQSIKHLRNSYGDTDSNWFTPIKGYPKKYPSVIEFVSEYEGYFYWRVHNTPVNEFINKAKEKLSILEAIDLKHRSMMETRNNA